MATWKKVLITVGGILGFLLLVGVVLVFVIPGWTFRTFFSSKYPSLDTTIETFTVGEKTPGRETKKLIFDDYSIEIGTEYEFSKEAMSMQVYQAGSDDAKRGVLLGNGFEDKSGTDLYDELDNEYGAERYEHDEVMDVLESFGYGRPDTAYTTQKLLYNINLDDCPTFGFRKTILYASVAIPRQVVFDAGYDILNYETDTVCGFVTKMGDKSDGSIGYAANLFAKDDLDHEWMMICRVTDEAEFADILASFTPL